MKAKTVTLIAPIPEGMPTPEHFAVVESEVAAPGPNEILVQALVFSADPYLRGGMKTAAPNSVVTGFIAGKILESNNEKWKVGDLFGASLPFSTVQVVSEKMMSATLMWNLTPYLTEDNISLGIGVLGMPGATAYGGVVHVLRPKKGETFFVSAAAGAVGGLAGQLAKQVYDCKVIGSAGGAEKNDLIKSKFGFDHAIDYKTIADKDELIAALKAVAPDGIDMYFENVGGMHWDAAFASLRPHGRIGICGCISGYNSNSEGIGQGQNINIGGMIYTMQRIEGFLSVPFIKGEIGDFLGEMSKWHKEGKLVVQETFFEGVDAWPMAFQALFTGKNKGKVVIKV